MNDLVERFDNLQYDKQDFISVVFQQSTALMYPLAVNAAKKARKYRESKLGNRLIHCAIFDNTAECAAAAVSLIETISELKGVQVWVLGEIILNPFNVSEVLKCYYTSLLCDDPKAHCIVRHDDKPDGYRRPLTISIDARYGISTNLTHAMPGEKYLIPCRRIDNQYGHSGLYENHPASLEDQIQSMAVHKGCHWCPNFDKRNFRKLAD